MSYQVQQAVRKAPRSRGALLDYEAAWAEFHAPVDKLNELKRDISDEYDEARNLVAPNSNQSGEGAVKVRFGPEMQLYNRDVQMFLPFLQSDLATTFGARWR